MNVRVFIVNNVGILYKYFMISIKEIVVLKYQFGMHISYTPGGHIQQTRCFSNA